MTSNDYERRSKLLTGERSEQRGYVAPEPSVPKDGFVDAGAVESAVDKHR